MVFLKEAWLTTKLADQTKNAIEELRSGKKVEEIARNIYMSAGQKKESVANSMVESMKSIIENYHEELLDKEKDEQWVERKLDSMVAYMNSSLDRCRAYYRALVLLGAYSIYYSEDGNSTKNAEAFIRKKGEFSASESEAEIHEPRLRAQLKESLLEMNCPLHPVMTLMEQVSAAEEEFSFPSVVAEFGRKSADMKLIMAMQAYVNYINGEYNGKEVPLSMDAIIYAVCAGVDYNALEKEPTLRDRFLTRLADLLLCVLIITSVSVVAILLFEALQVMFGIVWGIAIFIFCLVAFCFADLEQDEPLLLTLGLSIGEIIKNVLLLPYAIFEGAKKGIVFLAKKLVSFFEGFDGGGGSAAAQEKAVPETEEENEKEKSELHHQNKNYQKA